MYWFCHISKWICHRCTCVPHPEPSSLPQAHLFTGHETVGKMVSVFESDFFVLKIEMTPAVLYLFLAVLGFCCCTGFSLVAVSRAYSPVAMRGPLYTVASLVAASGLQSTGSAAMAHGLRCASARGIFPDQRSNHVSCIGRWILYHWATREAPSYLFISLGCYKE